MSIWRPDPTFYPSPKMAMDAPAEKLAYVAMVNDGKITAVTTHGRRGRRSRLVRLRPYRRPGGYAERRR